MASDYSCLTALSPASTTGVLTRAGAEFSNRDFKKSHAQVASSVAPHVAHSVAHEGVPHSAGRRPIPRTEKKNNTHGLRLRPGEIDLIRDKAKQHGMNVNAYIRAKALGDDYIERPPEWLRDSLLKLYVEFVRQGNNLNQIARQVNRQEVTATTALIIADKQRQPLTTLLQKLELALAGRRPPNDY